MSEALSRRSSRSLCRQARGPSCQLENPGEAMLGLIAAEGEKGRRKDKGKECVDYGR